MIQPFNIYWANTDYTCSLSELDLPILASEESHLASSTEGLYRDTGTHNL